MNLKEHQKANGLQKTSGADFSIDGQCKSGHSNVHLVPIQKSSSPQITPNNVIFKQFQMNI